MWLDHNAPQRHANPGRNVAGALLLLPSVSLRLMWTKVYQRDSGAVPGHKDYDSGGK